MSEAQNEVKEPASVALLRRRVRELDRLIEQGNYAISGDREHIAEVEEKIAEHIRDRKEVEDAIEVLSNLNGGAA